MTSAIAELRRRIGSLAERTVEARTVLCGIGHDRNPIEAGKLPDGSPDLYFRGFYCWNSEVGAKTLGMASFYLRAVCQNRNLWGVEDFQEITIRHSKYAASRFAHEATPALTRFANSSPQGFVNGIKAARQQIVARTDEDRDDFLRKRGVTPIAALGADFDPNFHQAVIHETSPAHREGEVIEELQRGYMLGDKLLRPAMVKVAKA